MTDRPNAFPDFCTGNPAGMAQPSSAQQASGYVPGEVPAAEHENWLKNTTSKWLRYLDSQSNSTVLASSLDFSTRLLGGGTWSLAQDGTTLAWSASAFVAIPSANDGDNTIAAGSAVIPSGSVAYVTANMPFSTKATTTSGSAVLKDVLYGDMAQVGQMVIGSGIPANTTVSSKGADGTTVTLSNAATASASGVTVTFRSAGTLSVGVAQSSSFVPGPMTVVIARGVGSAVVVGIGSGQMLVRQGEAKQLLQNGYGDVLAVRAGVDIVARQALYVSPGAADGSRTAGSAYLADASGTSSYRAACAGFAGAASTTGNTASIVSSGQLPGFTGLTPGAAYYLDPATPGGITTAQTTAQGQYRTSVGVAISATTLFVSPSAAVGARAYDANLAVPGNLTVTGTTSGSSATYTGTVAAQTFNTSSGFKSVVTMGSFTGSVTPNTNSYLLQRLLMGGGTIDFLRVMTHPGRIVGVYAQPTTYGGGTMTVNVRINGNGYIFSGGSGGSAIVSSSASIPFAAGDVLSIAVVWTVGGSQGIYADLTLNFTP